MGTLWGSLGDEGVVVTGELSELAELAERGYGSLEEGALRLTLIEAAELARQGALKVVDRGRSVETPELIELIARSNPEDFLRFLVYSDLRKHGRVLRIEPATPFLRLYPRGGRIGKSVAKSLVLPLSEDEPITHSELLDYVTYAGRLRKSLVMAVVDDEMNVTYYEATGFLPQPIGPPRIPEGLRVTGRLTHDRVIVWDPEKADALYMGGFWGHHIGVEKPRPNTPYRLPLQMSLFEALYLVEAGVLDVESPNGSLSADDLRRILSEVRRDAEARYLVFKRWRDLGYVAKPASKYGSDFMVYEKGPGIDHAPYLCLVGRAESKITPVELIRAGRIATSVRKSLVVSVVAGDSILSYKLEWYRP
ncbi:MAG TPA: tRNA-intron lyase [Candidatus Korarchaeota archaeon]|nr:tRNA-intron lyase [Candidatus Korarchaeota archaeon]